MVYVKTGTTHISDHWVTLACSDIKLPPGFFLWPHVALICNNQTYLQMFQSAPGTQKTPLKRTAGLPELSAKPIILRYMGGRQGPEIALITQNGVPLSGRLYPPGGAAICNDRDHSHHPSCAVFAGHSQLLAPGPSD